MKRLFAIIFIAMLLLGQALSLKNQDLFMCGDDDLIEIHNEKPYISIS